MAAAPDPARRTVCGVDGCPGGWLAVTMPAGAPDAATARIVRHAADLLGPAGGAGETGGTPAPPPDAIAIDIPIGLMATPEDGPRPPDRAARAFLRAHNHARLRGVTSRVFSAPTRAHLALWAAGADYAALRAAFPPPRALSKQCWNICDRIAELDALCRARPQAPLYEAHPEVAFAARAGRTLASKKTPAGAAARRQVLADARLDPTSLAATLTRGPARWREDDLLDAAVLALVAAAISAGSARRLPPAPEHDDAGLRRSMLY